LEQVYQADSSARTIAEELINNGLARN